MSAPDEPEPTPRRLYLHEPGWSVGHKSNSVREFCYTMRPGQDYYHRLQTGELYLFNTEERICIACAQRRGLLSYEPRLLRDSVQALAVETPDDGAEFEVKGPA